MVVIVCWTQIAAIQRTQECRLIQITVHQRAFKLPAQSIVEREFRGYSPGVLRVETVAVVLLGLVYVVGRRLAWIPHAHHMIVAVSSPGCVPSRTGSVARIPSRQVGRNETTLE